MTDLPPSPSFTGATSGSGALGAFGLAGLALAALNAQVEGAAAQRKAVFDPAVAIRQDLVARLAQRFTLEIQKQAAPGAPPDLTLTVRTSAWGFQPVRIGHYGVTYDGTLTLMDNRTNATLASGDCSWRPVDSPDAPTYDQMMANEGAVLKQMLGNVEDFCREDYRKRVLGLYGN